MNLINKILEKIRVSSLKKEAADLRRKILFFQYEIERSKLEIDIAETTLQTKLKLIEHEDIAKEIGYSNEATAG